MSRNNKRLAGGAATWRQAVKAAPRAGAGRGAMEVDAGGRAGGGGAGAAAALAPGHAKWAYLALFLLTSLTSWLLRDHADGMLRGVPALAECAGASSSSVAAGGCRGKEAVLRLSMATFLFFFAHCVAVAGVKSVDDPRGRAHTSFFLPKTFLLVGLLVALFFAPNQVLEGYGQFARAGSALFLVFQIIVLLDSVYRANERLLERTAWPWQWRSPLCSSGWPSRPRASSSTTSRGGAARCTRPSSPSPSRWVC